MIESIKGAFLRHVLLIKANGWSMFWLVLKRFLGFFIGFIPAFIFVVTIRCIRSIFLIRIFQIWSQRIGHFALNTELYLCYTHLKIKLPEQRFIDICYFGGIRDSNKQLVKMWRRSLRVWPKWIMEPAYFLNELIPGGAVHKVSGFHIENGRDIYNTFERAGSPHISFTEKEKQKGTKILQSYGLTEDSKFVCLLVRDSSYLNKTLPYRDHSYHNYRDSDINNYRLVSERLAEMGYYVFRMGEVVNQAFNSKHPNVIDYASNGYRTDFMDIYLTAHCEFMISTGTGIDSITDIFRKPIIYVNFAPIGLIPTFNSKSICITKKLYSNSEQRFLSLKEIFEIGLAYSYRTEWYSDKNVSLIENTPQEILEVVIEHINKEKGKFQYTSNDNFLQYKFWETFKHYAVTSYVNKQFPEEKIHGELLSRMGNQFLNSYSDFLI